DGSWLPAPLRRVQADCGLGEVVDPDARGQGGAKLGPRVEHRPDRGRGADPHHARASGWVARPRHAYLRAAVITGPGQRLLHGAGDALDRLTGDLDLNRPDLPRPRGAAGCGPVHLPVRDVLEAGGVTQPGQDRALSAPRRAAVAVRARPLHR